MATRVFSAKEELNKVLPLGLLGVTLSQLLFREKVVAPHSSTLAWKIPWMEEPGGPSILAWKIPRTEEPGGLQSMELQRHPTPALLPEKSHGWRSLVGRSPWGR